MKVKTKEIYFIFAFIIVFILGFMMGAYFTTEMCKNHVSFRGEYIEKCFYERDIYQSVCGQYEELIGNTEVQDCINVCLS